MIYFILSSETNSVKIGYTANDAKKRLLELQTGNPIYLVLIGMIEGDVDTKKYYHEKFVKYRQQGEWFFFGEDIKNFITDVNNGLTPTIVEKKDTTRNGKQNIQQRIFDILKDYGLYNCIKYNPKNKNYYLANNDTLELFDYKVIKKKIAIDYGLFVNDKHINSVLSVIAEEVIIPTNNNTIKDKDKLIKYVQFKINNNEPFRLKDIISDLKLQPTRKHLIELLISNFNLEKPTITRSYNNIKGYWWNL